jgi:endonuclease/exonuclease/phosphatase family metal-dependent hydrolase
MRVATFNILNGRSPEDGRVDLDRFAAAIRDLDPDVLALQEVDRAQDRSGHADLTAVAAEAMGAVDHRFVPALCGTPGGEWTAATGDEPPGTPAYGVALLTRFPAHGWHVVRLPALRGRAPYRFYDQRWPHLVTDEPRVGMSVRLDSPLGELTVATTHLSFLPGWNVVQLRRLMRALRGNPQLVLAGDLNLGPAAARRVTRLESAATAATFPADAPVRQIDHLLAAGLPAARSAGARETGLSDHRALLADW